MESNLLDIYKSAIKSMKNEIARLNLCIAYQTYSKKFQSCKSKIKDLTEILLFHTSKPAPNIFPAALSGTHSFQTQSLEDKISTLTQSLNKQKRKKIQEQEYLETNLKELNINLYYLTKRLNDAKVHNTSLRKQQLKSAAERKKIIKDYAKITNSLIKDASFSHKTNQIEELEMKTKKKVMRIHMLHSMINEAKAAKTPGNPEVKAIWDKYKKILEERKQNEENKNQLIFEIQSTQSQIENLKSNPEKIPPAVANKNLRQEINSIQLEISMKSKVLKGLNREKLEVEYKYSEVTKKKLSLLPKTSSKTLIKSNTSSTLYQDHTSKNYSTKESNPKTYGNSCDIDNLIRSQKDCTLSEQLLKALDPYAPGKGITAKIIAFNRGTQSESSRIN
jgi:hypothetical protein